MERDAEGRAAQTRRCTITTSVVRRVWSSLCLLIGLILLQSPSSPSSILPLLPSLHVASGFFLARINSTNIEAPSPFFVFGVREFLLTGELIRGFPEHGCEKLATNVTGKVVWIEPYHCSIESKEEDKTHTQKRGYMGHGRLEAVARYIALPSHLIVCLFFCFTFFFSLL